MRRVHSGQRAWPWLRRAGTAALLVAALAIVAMVTYLPHMQTLEGEIRGGGAVVNGTQDNPWWRLGTAYAEWANGTGDDYEYPMHVDADVHWVRAAAIQRADSLSHPDPYTGHESSGTGPLSLRGTIHERGFALAFAQFQEITGIPFLLIIRFFPALFASLSAWLVWAALRPWPGAPVAAVLVALVPSSPRFLGAAFWVPAGLGLAWVAVALVMARHASSDRRTLLLTLHLGAWAFFIHLIAGFAFLLVLLGALPVTLGRLRRDLLTYAALALLPVLWFFRAFSRDFEAEGSVLGFLPTDFTIFDQLGIPVLAAWVIGSALVVLRPPPEPYRAPVVAATIASAVALSFIVVNHAFDLRLYALYDRWHQPMALCAAVPVAYAIVEGVRWPVSLLRDRARTWTGTRRFAGLHGAGAAATVVVLISTGAVMAPGLAAHLDEPYYYFMTDEAWTRMQAAADIGPEYEVFLIHPWHAPIFTALSGKRPYTVLHPGTAPVNGLDYIAYHEGRYADDVWIVEREVSILLEVPGTGAPNFVPGPAGTALLDPTYVTELHAAQQARRG